MAKINSTTEKYLSVFLAENQLYGYKDQSGKIQIAPTYKSAEPFGNNGYAVVQNSKGLYGVITTENLVVEPFKYQKIQLFETRDYTLASTVYTYRVHNRFWLWDYFPNFSKDSTLEVLPLFERQKLRQTNQVKVLQNQQTLFSKVLRLNKGSSLKKPTAVEFVGKGFIIVGKYLFKYKKNAGEFKIITKNYIGFCDNKTQIVAKVSSIKARTYNTKGKRIQHYEILPTNSFTITYKGREHLVCIKKRPTQLKIEPVIYRETEKTGYYFVNAKFELALPVHLTHVEIDPDNSLVDIWQNISNIIPVVDKGVFIVETCKIIQDSPVFHYYSVSKNGTLKELDIKEVNSSASLKTSFEVSLN